MKKESRKDIHQIIKDKFGTNKLSDERLSKSKYWDSVTSNEEGFSESVRANPDILSDSHSAWPTIDSEDRALKLDSLKEVGESLKGREREVYFLLLKYPYTEIELSKKLKVSQQRVSAILQRIRQKVYKKYGSKVADLGL